MFCIRFCLLVVAESRSRGEKEMSVILLSFILFVCSVVCFSFSQYALRVPPAVTRLTVYRRLQLRMLDANRVIRDSPRWTPGQLRNYSKKVDSFFEKVKIF